MPCSHRPAAIDNLVLLTIEEADAHDQLQDGAEEPGQGLALLQQREPSFFVRVQASLARARHDYSA